MTPILLLIGAAIAALTLLYAGAAATARGRSAAAWRSPRGPSAAWLPRSRSRA
jgi:hypothetical protein